MATQTVPDLGIDDGPPPPPEDVGPLVDDDLIPADAVEEDEDDAVGDLPAIDAEEELEPKALPVERVLVDEKGRSGVYTQTTLTYFGKIQLYGLLGRAVQIVMDGDSGLGLDDVMGLGDPRGFVDKMMASLPGADTSPDRAEKDVNIDDAAKMMAAFAKVVSVAPDLLVEAYCIILTPQKGHWRWLTNSGLPYMDDEMGTDILHTFVDQNWGVMEDFFARELPKLFRRAAKARQRHKSAGVPSKR